jgi:Mn-dependent DtxR family transcriptional regulator
MKIAPSSSPKQNQVFTSALSKALSVSKSEVQKAISASKSEKISKHKKWKYVPEEGHERP